MPEILEKNRSSSSVSFARVPRHIAFIMDGNGRWAKARGLNRFEGHLQGVQTVIDIVDVAFHRGIDIVTLYAFSTENRSRPQEEISALIELLKTFLDQYLPVLLKNEIHLRIIGDLSWLPCNVRDVVCDAAEQTKKNRKKTLVVALNYSSRDEVLRAVGTFMNAVLSGKISAEKPDWTLFSNYLDTAEIPDPDLVIRTSGELRLSNFLLLQSAYSELYFCDKFWPDFSAQDLEKALADYASRERRFGRTGEQVCKKE